MEKFDLSLWLKDKSRKVVTRRGNSVRIICTDRKHGEDDEPIVFLEQCNKGEFLLSCRKDGRSEIYDTPYDLFFADEEGLTKFDYAVLSIISDHNSHTDSIEAFAKRSSKKLLDLVRKEVEKEITKEVEQKAINHTYAYQNGYENGKYDALKDLPKWKKITEEKQNYLAYGYLSHDGYYLSIQELKDKLPKEE